MKRWKIKPLKAKTNNAWTVGPRGAEAIGKEPFPPDQSDLQRMIDKDPIGTAIMAQTKFRELEAGYHRKLYDVLATAYGLARLFGSDEAEWVNFYNRFVRRGDANKPKAKTQHWYVLRYTLNFVFDAGSKQKRNRTGKYAKALMSYYNAGMPVHIVAAEIEKDGGIEALYEIYRKRKKEDPKNLDHQATDVTESPSDIKNVDELMLDNDLEFDEATEDDPLGETEPGSLHKHKRWERFEERENNAVAHIVRGLDPKGRRTIELEVTRARQSRFFKFQKGRTATVKVESLGKSKDGWRRLEVTSVNWRSSTKPKR